jgi:FAD/FMN-containing dehydrogenase
VLRPANTRQVSDIVKICAKKKIIIVPQGGNTGLVGGATPYNKNSVVINLSRMNAIRSIDPQNFSMLADAGCMLAALQKAAQEKGLYFPLRMGSQESCTIGGNIAANAGGILTLRYGNTRDLVLGLEVVLPDGEIWNGLRSLRKDNTGYALKHLFIGSEGTLGIVTGAVLKLSPDPGVRESFFAATSDLPSAITLLSELRSAFGENVSAYELLSKNALNYTLNYNKAVTRPVDTDAPWYILGEITGGPKNEQLKTQLEDVLAACHIKNLILDATLAQNEQQRAMFWSLRECVSDAAQFQAGGSIKHDISVPVFKIPDFVRDALAVVEKIVPNVRPAIFGHAGDGNLHFDLTKPDKMPADEFVSKWPEIYHAVHDVVQNYNGSIAAEHGVGMFKAKEFVARKSPIDVQMMQALKHAIDPANIMNPGVIWPSAGGKGI